MAAPSKKVTLKNWVRYSSSAAIKDKQGKLNLDVQHPAVKKFMESNPNEKRFPVNSFQPELPKFKGRDEFLTAVGELYDTIDAFSKGAETVELLGPDGKVSLSIPASKSTSPHLKASQTNGKNSPLAETVDEAIRRIINAGILDNAFQLSQSILKTDLASPEAKASKSKDEDEKPTAEGIF